MNDSSTPADSAEDFHLTALRLVLVDDEPLALKRLRGLLTSIGAVSIEAEFTNAELALKYLQTHSADAVFLDLRMPGVSGLDIIKALNGLPTAPAIVVTTAWLDHALEAYGPLSVAYLLKPISAEALSEAMEKVKLHLRQRLELAQAPDDDLERLAHVPIVASEGKRNHRFLAGEVSFFRAENKYVCAYMKNLSRCWLSESLNQLMEKLDPLFVRIHRNAAVNRREVEYLHRQIRSKNSENFRLLLGVYRYQQALEVSRTHHRQVRALFKFLETAK